MAKDSFQKFQFFLFSKVVSKRGIVAGVLINGIGNAKLFLLCLISRGACSGIGVACHRQVLPVHIIAKGPCTPTDTEL